MKTRKEIPEKYKWDLSYLCQSEEEFEEKFAKATKLIEKGDTFKGKLKDKKMLVSLLKYEREFNELVSPFIFYYHNMKNVDLSNSQISEKVARCSNLLTKYSQKMSYVHPEMSKFSDKYLDELISDPKLKDYDYTFRQIKKHKKHALSESEAKVIAGMNFTNFDDIFSLFSDVGLKYEDAVDSKGKKHELTDASRSLYMESRDEVLRKSASLNTHKAYGQFIDFLSENYICEIKKEVFSARLAKYNDAVQGYLDDEDVSMKIYEMLTKKVNENIPLINEFFSLKKKKLGFKTLHNYDLFLPCGKANSKKYTFEEGLEIIKKALAVLGDDYVEELENTFKERRIDAMPSLNKYSGAYENAIYGFPPVVLTNFVGNLSSVSTLAHELGHAMQSYYSNKCQPREKAGYPIFLAEIASTTNELLLSNYLLSALPDKEKLNILDDLLAGVQSTIFRQMMFSEFEKYAICEIQEDRTLDKDKLCGKYFSLCKKYMPRLSLLPELKYEWARVPHFFMGFYVYKYAIGMICALNFSSRILAGEEGIIEKYKGYLSAGGNKTPNEILKDAGCDLEDEKTYDCAFELVKKYIKDYKNL